MTPLEQLASLLRPGTQTGSRPMSASEDIDILLRRMRKSAGGGSGRELPDDLLLEAVRGFWQSMQVKTFRDAYLLSAGLCIPHMHRGPCVLEDRPRLQAVLDGVDGFSSRPSAFRRCYQGLMKSYFTYDAMGTAAPSAARNNWKLLRDYLHHMNGHIRGEGTNPDWVATANGNPHLFSENPCEPYVNALLKGDVGAIDRLCEELGIAKASWFLRELVLAQVKGATKLNHSQFEELMPRLLELLVNNPVLQDRGLVMLLDRYVQVPGAHLHPGLRDASVLGWGNPWLPSNETRWGGVTPDAREMVAVWLKLEFIEAFFTKLAEDGMGDRRRLEFWKRYVKSIDHVEFALGSAARNARDRDFLVLRKKMTGLICRLEAAGNNNAFIMRLGNLVAVEFSGMGNALYGYDAQTALPFDTSEDLRLAVDWPNSLKQKSSSILWLSHQDSSRGWEKWEHMFEATLLENFAIEPDATPARRVRRATPAQTAGAPAYPTTPQPIAGRATSSSAHEPADTARALSLFQLYTRPALDAFASRQGLQIEDMTGKGGSLWVRTNGSDQHVSNMLSRWGFQHRPGKGWWK